MIKTTEELNLTVKGYRLMTREELQKFEEKMPEASTSIAWWLADIDPMDDYYIAYAEGNYTEDDMYCERGEANTHIRVVLDIDGVATAGLKAGDEFIYCGYVFTILDDNIAVSNNFLGCAKYYDEDVAAFMFSDDEITCTLDALLANLLNITSFEVSTDVETSKIYECEEASYDIVVPGTFSTIGEDMFFGKGDIHTLTIEEGVTKIDSSTFCGCNIENIALPNSLEEIGDGAFEYCVRLKELTLPIGLKKLGKAPFSCCSFKITVNEGNNYFKVVDGNLFSKDGKNLIYAPRKCGEKTYTAPLGTKTICEHAFAWNGRITEIVLPEGVEEIRGGAFAECDSLEKVIIPATVKKIELEFKGMNTFDALCSWNNEAKERLIIEAPKGSYAIEFAKEHNIKYADI